ncbi:hypothetical protein IMZ31_22275 (plasmid) [Pontibacillus sp. ALD_SL1]|uniref:hypothetical protein n=1 Tax=Pontibacillus sp. ALD_SL1 TaxID=2777185 RepID=UPI001A96E776|nr:hypothetical protein [Pontibacillus sp. ALD_SL1]QST02182.1 hypothetical protein IMZ31_22275 [Pontibacillus sp. ALD_SL1]
MKIKTITHIEVVELPYGIRNFYADVKTDDGVYGFDTRVYGSGELQLIGLDHFKQNEAGVFESFTIHEDDTEAIEKQLAACLDHVITDSQKNS